MAKHFNGAVSGGINFTALPLFTTAMSVSYWYRQTSAPGGFPNRFTIIYAGGNNGANINYYIFHDNGPKINFNYTTAGGSVGNTIANPSDTNVWHHVLITTDYSTIAMYLDGVSKSVTTTGTPATPQTIITTDQLRMGRFNTTTNDRLIGDLSDVALWDVVLSPAECAALFSGKRAHQVRPGSLAGYWPLCDSIYPGTDFSTLLKSSIGVIAASSVSASSEAPFLQPINPPTPLTPGFFAKIAAAAAGGFGAFLSDKRSRNINAGLILS